MATETCFDWIEADFAWNLNEYTWNEVCLAIEVAFGGGGGVLGAYENLPKEKKEQFITLILKVKGETIEEKKKIKDFKVTANDINLTITEVLKTVNVNVEK